MLFYVTMVTILMTSYEEVHKYCMDDWNLDKTHTNHWNKVWYTLHPINYVLNIVIGE